ncbi:RloB family protein [Saccharopolyspora indica]|uniref:RloB family protein n=1 Tax=Saccharopolyspora indica TaxID=1229659 RepID=UPI0022EB9C9B|nr:RloB family protein [Saccharopolyspora indica]MDA3643676.1 RloB family protein [Saccharopolyspora indica]
MCGADCTESQYLRALNRNYRGRSAKLTVVTDGVDPRTLVRKAAKVRGLQPNEFDEVWCVVDVDEFDVEPAVRSAKAEGVQLAVSNLCFEYWLLLHFEDCGTAFRTPADVDERLRRHVPTYDKTRLDFSDFESGVREAVARAKRRCDFGSEHHRNPSSGVWKLVEKVVPAESGVRSA